MRLKKLLSLILSALLLFTCLNTALFSVNAAEQLTVIPTSNYLRAVTQTAEVGDEITVEFTLPVAMTVENLQFGTNYDTDKLQLTYHGCTLGGYMANPNARTYNIKGSASNLNYAKLEKGDALFTYKFKVIASGEASVYLNLEFLKRIADTGKEVPVISAGIIYEDPKVKGDVNSDDVFDMGDVSTLQRYIAKYDETINAELADCNGDGQIDIDDVTVLQRVLAEIDTF